MQMVNNSNGGAVNEIGEQEDAVMAPAGAEVKKANSGKVVEKP